MSALEPQQCTNYDLGLLFLVGLLHIWYLKIYNYSVSCTFLAYYRPTRDEDQMCQKQITL